MAAIRRIEAGPRMSQAVVHGNTVYLAGQVGESGRSVAEQTKEILATVERLMPFLETEYGGSVRAGTLTVHSNRDLGSPLASGSRRRSQGELSASRPLPAPPRGQRLPRTRHPKGACSCSRVRCRSTGPRTASW